MSAALIACVMIPVRIESTPNLREHFHQRAKRARVHRQSAFYALKAARAPHTLPCTITLTRIAPRELDTDNLAAGCKGLRDGVADWLLVDDAHPGITWCYAQRKGKPKEYAAEVTIEVAVEESAA